MDINRRYTPLSSLYYLDVYEADKASSFNDKFKFCEPDGCLDDVVVEAEDEGEGFVGLELVLILLQYGLEQIHVSRSNGCIKKTDLFTRSNAWNC